MRQSRLLGILLVAACASEGDIDRTQPNKLPKSLFQGTWYVRQTVIDVPATSTASFVGEGGGLRWAAAEKVVWEIQEKYLIAWRAYEEVPGINPTVDPASSVFDTAPRPGQGSARSPDDYHDAPVAVFPISHFDIKRQYNAATGEESNVIYEDTTDRNWYERDYIRVDWAAEQITNYDFLTKTAGAELQYYTQENEGGADSFRLFTKNADGGDVRVSFENPKDQPDASQVYYFDMVGNLFMEPLHLTFNRNTPWQWSIPACILSIYAPDWIPGLQGVSCGPTQMKVRSSFLKVGPERLAYEPKVLDDRDMSKFGYFRTERLTYDRQRGLTQSGRIYLADRHNIWQQSFQTNEDGSYALDDMGQRVPLPMADRTPKPVVYHLSPNYPVEMIPVTERIASEWNRAFRRTVAVAKGLIADNSADVDDIPRDQVPDMFVLGYNGWVCATNGDNERDCVYDESKRIAEIGDLRYNFIAWVAQDQIAGPLGFGPHASDPETGEIINGTAYVYGAAVDRLATYALDIVRLLNGDVDLDDYIDGQTVRDWIGRNRNPFDPSRISPALANLTVDEARDAFLHGRKGQVMRELTQERPTEPDPLVTAGLEVSPTWAQDRAALVQGTPEERSLVNDEVVRAMLPAIAPELATLDATGAPTLDDTTLSQLSPLNWMSLFSELEPQRWNRASNRTLWLAEFSDTATLGLAKHYAGRTDYDAIWQELREAIYEAVMEHEVGHTIGLRHNFAGSYDSVNYFDRYWELRDETLAKQRLGDITNFQDFLTAALGQTQTTPTQIDARMSEFSYSSIMDYASRFYVEDIHGIGKYDEAAVLFGYGGYVEAFDVPRYMEAQRDEVCEDFPSNPICQQSLDNRVNLVEDQMKQILRERLAGCTSRYESRPRADSEYITEGSGWHYTQLPGELFGYEDLVGQPNKSWQGYRHRSYVPWTVQRAALYAEEQACEDRIEADPDQVDVDGDDYLQYQELQDSNIATERAIEVPYAFCGDETVFDNASCMRWDEGADLWEQTVDKIDAYENYYFFTHYKRDYVKFSIGQTLSTVLNRYFLYHPRWYQAWFLDEVFYPANADQTLDMMQYFAVYKGFNHLSRVLSRPSYGKYAFQPDLDQWQLSDGNPNTPLEGLEVLVPRGPGRADYSLYDGSDGYYYYQRVQSVGNFWDHLAATFATTVPAVASSKGADRADFRTFLIPYYLLFEEELNNLYEGLFLQEYERYSPRMVDGEVTYMPGAALRLGFTDGHEEDFDPDTFATPVAVEGYPIRVGYGSCSDEFGNICADVNPFSPDRYGTHFSKQIYAALYGSVFFQSLWSLDFNYRNEIWKVGSGDDHDVGAGQVKLECFDPDTGIGYGTVWDPSDPAGDATAAVRMVQRCQAEVDEYLTVRQYCDDTGPGIEELQDQCTAARFDVDDAVEKMEIQRALYHYFQYNF
jgi:hypothetical protein